MKMMMMMTIMMRKKKKKGVIRVIIVENEKQAKFAFLLKMRKVPISTVGKSPI
jgi:hypothetical protein